VPFGGHDGAEAEHPGQACHADREHDQHERAAAADRQNRWTKPRGERQATRQRYLSGVKETN
jgi:hypothetical protein